MGTVCTGSGGRSMWWIKVGFGLVVGLVLTVLSELPLWGWEHGLIELSSVMVCLS